MRRARIQVEIIGLVAAAFLAVASSASAIEEWEYEGPDLEALAAGDYRQVNTSDQFGTELREEVGRLFVAPLAESVSPGSPYGFSFAFMDLTGDGEDDLVLRPKIPDLIAPEGFDGVAWLVYVRDGGRWRLAIEGGGLAVGIREGQNGSKDIALAQFEPDGGIIEYVYRDGTYRRIDQQSLPAVR
jgi:hypothetical protein